MACKIEVVWVRTPTHVSIRHFPHYLTEAFDVMFRELNIIPYHRPRTPRAEQATGLYVRQDKESAKQAMRVR